MSVLKEGRDGACCLCGVGRWQGADSLCRVFCCWTPLTVLAAMAARVAHVLGFFCPRQDSPLFCQHVWCVNCCPTHATKTTIKHNNHNRGIELNSAEYQGKKGKALLDALKLHKQHSGLTDPELEMLGYMLSPARGPPHSTTRWSAQQLLERCPLVVQFVELHNQLGDRLTRSQAVQRLDTLAEQEQQQQAAARAVLGRGRRR